MYARQNYNNGPQCTQQGVVDFLNQTQSFMDGSPWVERYAWFGVMENLQGVNPDNAMMDQAGRITPLGEQYIRENSTAIQLSSATRTHRIYSLLAVIAVLQVLTGLL